MKLLHSLGIPVVRFGIVIALMGASLLSVPEMAFFPVIVAAGYLFLSLRSVSFATLLEADCFMFFTIPLLYSQGIPDYFACLFSLPVACVIENDLKQLGKISKYSRNRRSRFPTRVTIFLFLLIIGVLITGVIFTSRLLLLTDILAVICLTALLTIANQRMLARPIEEEIVEERVIAGSLLSLVLRLKINSRIKAKMFFEPLQDWVEIKSTGSSDDGEHIDLTIQFTPPLSGPTSVQFQGYAIDRWNLLQVRFVLKPLQLVVIPRARYAEWIAKRYLAKSQTGMLPLVATVSTLRPIFGLRTGIEYYGSRLYQPGDNLKNIDLKRTLKYRKLVSKEFADLHGQPAILLVNTAANDADEADRQIYNIIVTALSLAKEQIPTALAVYDERNVLTVTTTLQPQMLVSRCLGLAKDLRIIGRTTRYLSPPDIMTLNANINRLESVESPPANVLAQLLRIESSELKKTANQHPAMKALMLAIEKNGDLVNVIVVSPLNHDYEAIMFNTIRFQNRGKVFMQIN
jgi:hypothetical protein